jgi:hypothetical protein
MALFGKETEQDRQRAQAYARWAHSQNPYAIASAVLGIFSLIEMGVLIIFGVAGTALGVVALRQLKNPPPTQTRGAGLAWTGIVTSVVSLIIAGVLYAIPLFKS